VRRESENGTKRGSGPSKESTFDRGAKEWRRRDVTGKERIGGKGKTEKRKGKTEGGGKEG